MCLLFLCAACGSTEPLSGGEPPDSNREIIGGLFERIFDAVKAELEPGQAATLVVSGEQSAAQNFAETLFHAYLSENGFEAYQAGPRFFERIPDPEGGGAVLSLLVGDVNVDYALIDEKGAGKKLSRAISVQVLCKAADRRTGRVLLARTFDESYTDIISRHDAERVESNVLPFTVGYLEPEKRGLKEYLELSSVLTTAGVIIYLLFAMRS